MLINIVSKSSKTKNSVWLCLDNKEFLELQTLKRFQWLQRGSKFKKNKQNSSISNFRSLVTPIVCFLRSPVVVIVLVSYRILSFFSSTNFEIFWWCKWRQNWWITGTCRRATSCSLIRGSSILIVGQLLVRSRYANRHQQWRDSKKKKCSFLNEESWALD